MVLDNMILFESLQVRLLETNASFFVLATKLKINHFHFHQKSACSFTRFTLDGGYLEKNTQTQLTVSGYSG